MNIRFQLVAVAALYAGVTVAAANDPIKITNKLTAEMPITIAFASKESTKPSNLTKRRIKRNQTVTIKQPTGRNWVDFTIYNDASYKSPKKTLAIFNIADARFNNNKEIIIDNVSSNPKVFLNNIDLTPDLSM